MIRRHDFRGCFLQPVYELHQTKICYKGNSLKGVISAAADLSSLYQSVVVNAEEADDCKVTMLCCKYHIEKRIML